MEMTLGKRIAALRKEKELKQDDLAGMLDVSPQAVSKWENDQTCPDISLLPKLAQILGVTVDELLSGKREELPTVRLVPEKERKNLEDMMLRIVVDSDEGDKVRVNLPMTLVKMGMELGIVSIPGINGEAGSILQNVDLSKLLSMVEQGLIGKLVEVESADGDIVEIVVE